MLPKGLKNYTKFAPKFLYMSLTPIEQCSKKTADLVRDGTPYDENEDWPVWEGGAGSCVLAGKLCGVLPPSEIINVIIISIIIKDKNLERSLRDQRPDQSKGCTDCEREKRQRAERVAVPVLLRFPSLSIWQRLDNINCIDFHHNKLASYAS